MVKASKIFLPSKAVGMVWLFVLGILPLISRADTWGWDLIPFRNALHSLNANQDVYLRDIAAQAAFRSHLAQNLGAEQPPMYVYPPITLPVLQWLGALPIRFKAALFLVLCVLGFLLQVRAISLAFKPMEAHHLRYLIPFVLFFPGLLASSNILSGNVAYLLYGIILLAAMRGWTRSGVAGGWTAFYAAVLFASLFKAPYLTLLAIPVLSARSQWGRAGLTALAGIALFFGQAILWPVRFAHYLQALAVMFDWQHDFGSSPAGLFSTALIGSGTASSQTFLLVYLVYAIPLFGLLFYLSRRYLAGAFSLQEWMPILMVGVILLNPRIIEYDVAPLTIPLALIVWRVFAGVRSRLRAIFLGIGLLVVNAFALLSWSNGKLAEGLVLIVFFAAGCRSLWRSGEGTQTPAEGEHRVPALAVE